MSLQGDGIGHITVKVEAIAGPAMEVRLSFSFVMDQTQLPPVIAALGRCLVNDPTPDG